MWQTVSVSTQWVIGRWGVLLELQMEVLVKPGSNRGCCNDKVLDGGMMGGEVCAWGGVPRRAFRWVSCEFI
jgi:hypothetical protein